MLKGIPPHHVALMAVVPGDTARTVIWDEYRAAFPLTA